MNFNTNNYLGYSKMIFILPILALSFHANAQAVHTKKVNIGFAYLELNIRVFFTIYLNILLLNSLSIVIKPGYLISFFPTLMLGRILMLIRVFCTFSLLSVPLR